jgi:hypothetical protein
LLALHFERSGVDITVTRAAGDWMTWDLTDLLGRPMGRIRKHPGPRFIIEPNDRLRSFMINVDLGPHASLEEALAVIERHSNLVCRRTPEPP